MTVFSESELLTLEEFQIEVFLRLLCESGTHLIQRFGSRKAKEHIVEVVALIWNPDVTITECDALIRKLQKDTDYDEDDSRKPVYYSMRGHWITIWALKAMLAKPSRIRRTCNDIAGELVSIASCLDCPPVGTFVLTAWNEVDQQNGKYEREETAYLQHCVSLTRVLDSSNSPELVSLREMNRIHVDRLSKQLKTRFYKK